LDSIPDHILDVRNSLRNSSRIFICRIKFDIYL
jgi:hypothetical protein